MSKGVLYIRAKHTPFAACTLDTCGWSYPLPYSFLRAPAVTIRAHAERHVAQTGHTVNVDILDRTNYYPQGADSGA